MNWFERHKETAIGWAVAAFISAFAGLIVVLTWKALTQR